MTNALIDNIKGIPPVTRFFTISSVLACLGVTSFSAFPNLYINFSDLVEQYWILRLVIKKGQTIEIIKTVSLAVLGWYRFVTSFLIPSGIMSTNRINALFDIYFFYTFSNHLEAYEGKFKGNFPDYLWFIIICGTFIQFINFTLDAIAGDAAAISYFPHENLLACLTYVWSRSMKNALINLLGLVPIKAYYLPLGNLIIKLILGGPVALIDTLVGILSGYLYLCIQSNTIPFHNLLPGAYGRTKKRSDEGRRVGMTYVNQQPTSNRFDYIDDSIYDKGYLKAPKWLYKILSYPMGTSVRSTAFTVPSLNNPSNIKKGPSAQVEPTTANASGYSWFGGNGAFKGKGHRLGE
ncbi:hypothetical protein KGF56_000275 [Candida oxycetoniae]|uniref:Derlin n=1 Tax=Candida oxycetoniae TaxID=497107 RepID=A0AAI9X026_9ASCO|nr:uncharacterized protein KGF56_000275 [Candida oxycetoniae]KAI3406982.1 hypothetical protein KGF56_000275 [Candida oxycetoniae]